MQIEINHLIMKHEGKETNQNEIKGNEMKGKEE